jgi:hypothetical protein
VLDGVSVKLGLSPQIVASFAGGERRAFRRTRRGNAGGALGPKADVPAREGMSDTRPRSSRKLIISGMRADGLSVEVGLRPAGQHGEVQPGAAYDDGGSQA